MSGAGGVRRVGRHAAGPLGSVGPASPLAEQRALEEARETLAIEAVALAFELAERVLTQVAAGESTVAAHALGEALSAHRWVGPVLVRAHPDDVERCELTLRASTVEGVVYADRALTAGDVILEGREGAVDARLASRLARLRLDLERGP